MDCLHCQFANPPGMRFCGGCGARLTSACERCGAESPAGFKFCGGCGAPLSPAELAGPPPPPPAHPQPQPQAMAAGAVAPPPLPPPAAAAYTPPHLAEQLRSRTAFEGERKQVTVLFCDLVSSTALAEHVGPEAMHGLLRSFFELALGEVHRYGGTVNQFLGDGFMALFGAPVAHEDHARRAVLAALALGRALEQHGSEMVGRAGPAAEQEAVAELSVRIGLNTGWVVVGSLGDHLRMDYTAIGDTTNLAARLQQLAAPGAILISEATRSVVENQVSVEPLGPLMVKGKSSPVTAYRVLGTAESEAPSELARRELSPFVGREREIDVLEGLVELVAAGQGQVAGLTGEAGAGKSRLVFELRRRLERRMPVTWFTGRCLSYGQGVPYLPLVSLLRDAWSIAEADAPEEVIAKVAAGLAQSGAGGGESMPYLHELLGVRNGGEALAELGSQAIQHRIFAALREIFLRVSQRSLVVVEIEDLHWLDPTSEEFLARLAEDLPGACMLLLLTYRSGYRPPWLDKSYATQVAVRPLSLHESRSLVDAVLRRSDVSAELTAAILERAEGNPFFLEELARAVEDRVTGGDSAVPDTVHAVLVARIDRLPDEHKRLLQTAAVLGREMPRRLLRAVWESPPTLDALLQDLKRWEFIHEVPAADGRTMLSFNHVMIQEAAYQTLLTSRRQVLHAAAGRALEVMFAGRLEDAYASLAYHFPQADDTPKAVEYLARSAEWWARQYAHPEATKALQEALRHAERLPEAERDRRLVELVLQLAASLLPLARLPETLDLCLRHRERVEDLGDGVLAGRFYFWLAHTYSYLGDQAQAAASAERAIALAEQHGDDVTRAKAHYVLARDGFWSGRFARGVEHALLAAALLERHGERWWRGQAHWVAGFNDYALGHFEPALEAMARARAIGEALADPRLDTSWSSGYFYATMGEWEAAIRDCRGGVARSRDPLNTTAALGFLGYAYLEKGDSSEAVRALEPAVGSLRKAGMRQMLGWFCAFLAEAYLRTGRVDQASLLAQEALDIAGETRFGYGAGLAQRALGRIARQVGSAGEAADWLGQALATFSGLEARFEAGRSHLDLAALAQQRGDDEAAASHLGLAIDLFRELGAGRYLQRAEQLAAQGADSWLDSAAGGVGPPLRPDR
jgi:class 3 adenylate cyclase/tetratricopeptide (TPR) repeat protein